MSISDNSIPRATLAILALAALGGGCGDPDPQPVLGVSVSGAHMDAARLALRETAPDGPMPVDTMFIHENSNRAGPAIETAERFVSRPGMVAVIGHSNSSASLAASQIYRGTGIIQIAPHSTAVVYSQAGPQSYRLVPPDNEQGRFIARHLLETVDPGAPLALLYVNDDYGRGLRESVLEGLAGTLDLVIDLPHEESAQLDTAFIASSLDATDPAAVLWLGRVEGLRVLLPDLAGRGVPVIAGDGATTIFRDGVPAGLDLAVVDFVDFDATPALQAFRTRYVAAFDREPTGPDALTYDAVRLVLDGLEVAGPDGLKDWLDSLGQERPAWEGITGPVRFNADGDVERGYTLVRARGGRGP